MVGKSRVAATRLQRLSFVFLLTAFGTDRGRFEDSIELCCLTGTGPVRRASGKRTGKNASVHFRRACPKFLRQSFHE